jgi:hypothetical protein
MLTSLNMKSRPFLGEESGKSRDMDAIMFDNLKQMHAMIVTAGLEGAWVDGRRRPQPKQCRVLLKLA